MDPKQSLIRPFYVAIKLSLLAIGGGAGGVMLQMIF